MSVSNSGERGSAGQRPFRALDPAGAAAVLERAHRVARTGTLEVVGEYGQSAFLTLCAGEVCAARSGARDGVEAALRIFLWSEGSFRWLPADENLVGERRQPVAELRSAALVTEGLRRRAVWQRMLRELPAAEVKLTVDFAALAAGLGDLPPAAQDLCRLFDGRRCLGQVFADAELPELECASIIGHLVAARILRDTTLTGRPAPAPAPRPAPAPSVEIVPAIGPAAFSEETDRVDVARLRGPSRRVRLAVAGTIAGAVAAFALASASSPSSRSPIVAAPPAVAVPVMPRPAPPPPAAPKPPARPAPPPATAAAPQPRPLLAQVAAPGPDPVKLCVSAPEGTSTRRIIKLCEQAVTSGRAGAEVHAVLAGAELERGEFRRARDRAREALALDPARAEAYAYLGFAETELGREGEARAAYRQYLARAPQGRFAPDIRAILSRLP